MGRLPVSHTLPPTNLDGSALGRNIEISIIIIQRSLVQRFHVVIERDIGEHHLEEVRGKPAAWTG